MHSLERASRTSHRISRTCTSRRCATPLERRPWMFEFFRFELRYRLTQPIVYIFALLFALLAFGATTSDAVVIGGANGQTAINAPFVITQILGIFSMLS